MKTKELCAFVLLLVLFLALFAIAQVRVTDWRAEFSYRLQVSARPIPPTLLKVLAGEFKGVVADYLLLEAASFIGGATDTNDKEWDAAAHLLEQSSLLDPYFKQTYILAQGTLPWYAQKYDQTMVILERSRKHRTWDWRPSFFIGFNHYYFFKDNAAAAQAMMEAAMIPGASPTLATWAARLASKSGRHQTAIAFLTGMYEGTEDERQRNLLGQRITALQGAFLLQQAVERFQAQFGRLPDYLEELVDSGILSELPVNPYQRPYTLNEGVVEF
jgi:hypothetical protein